MSDERICFPLRLTKVNYQKYKANADARGISMNAYISECLYEFHNPLPVQGDNSGAFREIIELGQKIDQVGIQIKEKIDSDAFIRSQAATQITTIEDHDRLQRRILQQLNLGKIPMTDSTLARELNEDLTTILVVCSYLETQGEIKAIKQPGGIIKWCVKE